MRERPILFSKPMVLALLAGTKTQTRRVLRDGDWLDPKEGVIRMANVGPATTGFQSVACPYGEPSSRLWVREAWRAPARYDEMPPRDVLTTANIRYEADGYQRIGTFDAINLSEPWGKLRPSMFMPRWASRITLEVVSVRVEKLQDISEADGRAEGCRCNKDTLAETGHDTYRDAYSDLWEQINGIGSWDLNPWVWAIEFRRLA